LKEKVNAGEELYCQVHSLLFSPLLPLPHSPPYYTPFAHSAVLV